MRITVFDNHDSFTWNLAHDLERLDGVEVQVIEKEVGRNMCGRLRKPWCCLLVRGCPKNEVN